MLESVFATVFMVANEASLASGAGLLQPAIIIADLALAPGDVIGFVSRLRVAAPGARVLLLSAHDEPAVARVAIAAGADGVVLTRSIATDLLPGVDAVLSGMPYVSPAMRGGRLGSESAPLQPSGTRSAAIGGGISK
jgi:DNA-binding NarL/FixJ family response regulator